MKPVSGNQRLRKRKRRRQQSKRPWRGLPGRWEQLEDRTLLTVLSLEINLFADNNGSPGALIANDTVTVGDNFFVQITAEDVREDPQGVSALSLDIGWDSSVLTEVDANFSSLAAPIVTSRFPLFRMGSLDNTQGTITNLSGASLTGAGSPIGAGTPEEFSLLYFSADTVSVDSPFTLQIGASGLAFPDNASLDRVDIEPQTITVLPDAPTFRIDDVTVTEGDGAGTTTATFTVTRSDTTDAMTVDFATGDDTATAGSDYVAASGTLSFAAGGAASQQVTVQVNRDDLVELDERFFVNLTNATGGAFILDGQGVGTIANDDTATLVIDDTLVAEGDAPGTSEVTFTVTSDSAVDAAFSVDFATVDDTALAGDNDYRTASGTLNFSGAAGESRTVTVTVNGDDRVELNETFFVDLSNVTAGGRSVTLGNSRGVGTITNDDSATIRINDISLAEGNPNGTTTFTFTATLDTAVDRSVSVDFVTADGAAESQTGDADYQSANGTVTFVGNAGETQAIQVTVNRDAKVELDETFFVDLSNIAAGGRAVSLADARGQGTIENDDAASISIADLLLAEGNLPGTHTMSFVATLSAAVDTGVTVDFATLDNTAQNQAGDGDYQSASGTLSFTGTAGETRNVVVTINHDDKVELDETFFVDLSNIAAGGRDVTLSDPRAAGTIANDDNASLTINDVAVLEGNAPDTRLLTFTATLDKQVDAAVAVDFATADDTARTADSDYQTAGGTLNFVGDAGETQTFTVTITGDDTVERDEQFFANLSNLSANGRAVAIGDAQGIGTILNDDAASLSISDVTQLEGASPDTTAVTFTVTLSGNVDTGVSLNFATEDGTALTGDSDYQSANGTLSFDGTAGETETLTVTIQGDGKVELDEQFFVRLSNLNAGGRAVTLADDRGQGTIANDDTATVAISDVSQLEGNSPDTQKYVFTATLNAAVDTGISVDYATADGSATTADGDYQSASGKLTFTGTAGEALTLEVTVVGDNRVELDEHFFVNLTNLAASDRAVTLSGPQGQGTLRNDDSATVAIDDVALLEGDAPGTTSFLFTVTLSAAVDTGVAVNFATADGSAQDQAGNNDYRQASGTVNFAGNAGETQTVEVLVNGDDLVEDNENFFVNLTNIAAGGRNVIFLDSLGEGTILNDDTSRLSVSDASIDEGDGAGVTTLNFTVSRTDNSGQISVDYRTVDGLAIAGQDYTAVPNTTLTFAAGGALSQQVSVDILRDDLVERDETFSVVLSNVVGVATIVKGEGIGTIRNDDEATLSIDDASALEGDGSGTSTLTFTVTLDADIDTGFTVDFVTADGSAQDQNGDGDYQQASGTLTFAGTGGESHTLTVTVNHDDKVELDEQFLVNLSNLAAGGRLIALDHPGTGTIRNDDSAQVTINDVRIAEGDTGTTALVFTATLDAAVDRGIAVDFATSNDSAQDQAGDGDYQSASGTLNFVGTAGETQTISVTVNGDAKVESDEQLFVTLSNIVAGLRDVTFADDRGVGTLENDDTASIFIEDVQIAEGNGSGTKKLVFTATLNAAVDVPVSVDFATADGSAGDAATDNDYQAANGTLTFAGAANETQTLDVVINADDKVELDEQFFVNLTNVVAAGRAVSISGAQAAGTIQNDDSAKLTINDVALQEGDSPDTVVFEFTVTLDQQVDTSLSFDFATADGIAQDENGSGDYQSSSGSRTLAGAAGETASIQVTVNGEEIIELDETFFVRLSNLQASGRDVTFTRSEAVGTILNDDGLTLILNDVSIAEGNGTGTTPVTFTVTRNNNTSEVVVDYAVVGDTAAAGGDFVDPGPSQIRFAADGAFTQQITVDVVRDDIVELDETFFVRLLSATGNATITDGEGVGTILNDDAASLAVADASQRERDSGTRSMTFRVSLSQPVDVPVEVTIGSRDGSATTADADYSVLAPRKLTFTPGGARTQDVTVDVVGDEKVELDESFFVDLSSAAAQGRDVTISDSEAVGTITNDDTAFLIIDDVARLEGNDGIHSFSFRLTLSAEVDVPVAVTANTADETASAGEDYTAVTNHTVTFPAGAVEQSLVVSVNRDNKVEDDETFLVLLSGLATAGRDVQIADAQGRGRILNDDRATVSIDDVTVVEGNSGTTIFNFQVRLSQQSDQPVSFDVHTDDDTAAAGSDYTAIQQRVTFQPGDPLVQSLPVEVTADDHVEVDETFFVRLSNLDPGGRAVTLGDAEAVGTILNDDDAELIVTDVTQLEGDSGTADAQFEVRLSQPIERAVSVLASFVDQTASRADGDYSAPAPQTLTFQPGGPLAHTLTATIAGDTTVERNETFVLRLANLDNNGLDVAIADAEGVGTIQNDDAAALSISDATLLEGDTGSQLLAFDIALSQAVDAAISIDVSTVDGTATAADNDYSPLAPITLNFAASSPGTQVVEVPVMGDSTVELNEAFQLLLGNLKAGGRNVTISKSAGTGTIQNDDNATLVIDDVTVTEGDAPGTTLMTFSVTLDQAVDTGVTVEFATADGTATGGPDYVANSGSVTFQGSAGEVQTIDVTVRGDSSVEDNETLFVDLSQLMAAGRSVSIADPQGQGTILDDDRATLSIGEAEILEGNTGSRLLAFTVTLSQSVDVPVEVDASTVDSTATVADRDYLAVSGATVRFSPGGPLEQQVEVPVLGDTKVEFDEAFLVRLSNLVTSDRSVTLALDEASGRIRNDDSAQITVGDVNHQEGAAGSTSAMIPVRLSSAIAVPVTVQISSSDGTATVADNDYVPLASTAVTFTPGGSLTQHATVEVVGDEEVELNEQVNLSLQNLQNGGLAVTIGDGEAILTIVNDDEAGVSVDDVTRLEGDSGRRDFGFRITLSDPVDAAVTVQFQTADGTATVAGNDYFALGPQTVTFLPGDPLVQFVNVEILSDEVVELDETFTVSLSNLASAGRDVTIIRPRATGIIFNDDESTLTVDNVTLDEGDSGATQFNFTVSLNKPLDVPVNIDVATLDGTATAANADFAAVARTISFLPGDPLQQKVTVDVQGDLDVEPDETFTLQLSNVAASGRNVKHGQLAGTGTILNDDTEGFTVSDVSVLEGQSGETFAVFVVEVAPPPTTTVSVRVNTADGTAAVANNDYTPLVDQLVTFMPGETSKEISVAVLGDTVVEPDEFFTVNLSDPVGSVIDDGQGIGTILNDDVLGLTIDDVRIDEGNAGTRPAVFTVSLSPPAAFPVTVRIDTFDDSALVADNDYQPLANHVLSFAVGESVKTVAIPVVGDLRIERDETFLVVLSLSDGARIADAIGIGTIVNDDSASIAIGDVTQVETDSGTTAFEFPVTLSQRVDFPVSMNVATRDDSATVSNNDYQPLAPTTITFHPGDPLVKNVTVLVNGDRVAEADETFFVDLSNLDSGGRAVSLADAEGLGTIVNDDFGFWIDDLAIAEGNSGMPQAVLTVNLSPPPTGAVSVRVATADGTARVDNNDYLAIDQEVVFQAGETQRQITVPLVGDVTVESDETIVVQLSDPVGAPILDDQALVTVLNDDTAEIRVGDVTLAEGTNGSTLFTFPISLSAAVDVPVQLTASTADGSAVATSGDYTGVTGQAITFTPGGSLTASVMVQVDADSLVELDETFLLRLANLNAGGRDVTLVDAEGQATITNDDSASLTIDDVARVEGNSGTSSFEFTIRLDQPVDVAIQIDAGSAEDTATLADNDFQAASSTVTIPAGTQTAVFSVTVIGDVQQEPDEQFLVNLSNLAAVGRDVSVADPQAEGTIINDDLIAVSIGDATLAEGDSGTSVMSFTVTLSEAISQTVTVDATLVDGTATAADSDFNALPTQTLTFAPGDPLTQTISVEIIGDERVELDETFRVELANLSSGTVHVVLGKNSGLGTITNDDTATITIDDVSHVEGDSGTTDYVFTIKLDTVVDVPVSVNAATADGTASAADGDYSASNQTITWQPGELTRSFTVKSTGDVRVELDEIFLVELTNLNADSRNVILGDGQGEGTVRNDDSAELIISDVRLAESDSGTADFIFTLTLDQIVDTAVTVRADTLDDTATVGDNDYQALAGQAISIAAGQLTQTVTVPVTGDGKVELDETFFIDLSNLAAGGRAVSLLDPRGLGEILNDDQASILMGDVTLAEGDSGTTNFVFSLMLDQPVDQPVSVDFATADALATVGDGDYTAVSQTVTWPAGSLLQTVTVPVAGDRKVERDENFTASLTNLINGGRAVSVSNATATATISNDDAASLTINDVTQVEGDSGSSDFVFTLSLNNPADVPIEIQVATADDTATVADGDYAPLSGQTVTISAGQQSQTVAVSVNGDLKAEADESFTVTLNSLNAQGRAVSLGDAAGQGVILNDDVVTVDISDTSVLEGHSGTSDLIFTVALSQAAVQPVSVDVTLVDGSALVADGDYQGAPVRTLTFNPGETSQSLAVAVNGDLRVELDETVRVLLSNLQHGGADVVLGDVEGLGTILNDDAATLSVNNTSRSEGDSGAVNLAFTVTLSHRVDVPVSVDIRTVDGLASATANDYVAVGPRTLTFLPGQNLTQQVTVQVNGDETVELDETLFLDLSNIASSNRAVSFGAARGTGTINNDDVALIAIDDLTRFEGDAGTRTANFLVTLSNPVDVPITVNARTLDETASSADADYVAIASQPVAFAAGGSLTQTVAVTINGDERVELDETLLLELFDLATDGRQVTLDRSQGRLAIMNDDSATISIDDVTLPEGNSGATPFVFTLTLSQPADTAITVEVTTSDAVALVADQDYQALVNQPVTFQPGQQTQTVAVQVEGDLKVELDELFLVGLGSITSGGRSISLGDAEGRGTILNDDSVLVNISDAAVAEGDNGITSLEFSVSLSAPVDRVMTVDLATSDGTALAASDYNAATQTLTFNPGGPTTQIFSVELPGDELVELDETLLVTLSNLNANGLDGALGDSQGTGTIINDDESILSVAAVSLPEGDSGTSTLTFTLVLSHDVEVPVQVDVETADDTATAAGGDYVALARQTMNFAAGVRSQTVSVQVAGDEIVELDEVFNLVFSGLNAQGRAVTLAAPTGEGTILNDDAATIAVNDVSLLEGDTGTQTVEFVLTLSDQVDIDVSLDAVTADGTALAADNDYSMVNRQVTFPSTGSLSQVVSVTILGDQKVELNETFVLDLLNLSAGGRNVTLSDSQGEAEILNDDAATLAINDLVLQEGDTGVTDFTFTLTLSHPVDTGVVVGVSTADNTATVADLDYAPLSGQLVTIPADTVSHPVTVSVTGDERLEPDETFFVNLVSLDNAGRAVTISDASGQATILNDDQAKFSVDDVTVAEGDSGTSTLEFTVTLSRAVVQPVSVDVAISDGSATVADNDFTAPATTTLTFQPGGPRTQTVAVQINGDQKVELDETIEARLSNVVDGGLGVMIQKELGIGTIANDDQAALSVTDASLAEGDTGTQELVFTVTLDGNVDQGFSVDFATQDGTAGDESAGGDYQAASGTLAFTGATGQAHEVRVVIVGDRLVEDDENFLVSLLNLQAGGRDISLASGQGTGTIGNDDRAVLDIADVSLAEGNSGFTAFTFNLTLSNPVDRTVSFDAATADGTAVSGSDYSALLDQFAFPAAETVSTVVVNVMGDTTVELDETFLVRLSNLLAPGRDVSLGDTEAQATISNDDAAIVSIGDVSQAEGNSGTTALTFQLTLSQPVDTAVTVEAATSDGSATTADNDYAALASQGISFAAGQVTQTVTVQVTGDERVELDESFFVDLTNLAAGGRDVSLPDARGEAQIQNDDGASLTISDATVVEGDSGSASLVFNLTLSHVVDADVIVDINTVDGTAQAGSDYTALNAASHTIPAGQLSQTVTVAVSGETLVELNETLLVNIASLAASGRSVTITDGQGEGTIENDDSASVTISDLSLNEGNSGVTEAVLTLTLSDPVDAAVVIQASTADGSATAADADYEPRTAFDVSFAPGSLETTLTINLVGDEKVELNETLQVDLTGISADGRAVTLAETVGQISILNDDQAQLSVTDVARAEGDSGSEILEFTVSLSQAVDHTVTVDVALVEGTARLADNDFEAFAPTTLTFEPGQPLTQTVAVRFFGDQKVELVETVLLQLSNPTSGGRNVLLGKSEGVGTILNDDTATLSINDVSAAEGNAGTQQYTFTVTLDRQVDVGFDVDFATANDTATAGTGSDYLAGNGTLTFAGNAGETQQLQVTVHGDTLVELNETFLVQLNNLVAGGRAIGISGAQGTGTINNDDAATITVTNLTQAEGDTGTTDLTLALNLSNPTDVPISLVIDTADDTARVADADYVALSGLQVTVPAGVVSVPVVIELQGDTTVELDETLRVRLSNLVTAGRDISLAASEVVATILNDDSALLSINDIEQFEGDSGITNFVFTLTLTRPVDIPLNVEINSFDGSALSGDDYVLIASDTVTIPAGQVTQEFTVQVVGDETLEPDENFFIEIDLGDPSGRDVTTSVNRGQGIILDDDQATISVNNVSVTEGDSGTREATFTVSLSRALSETVSVDLAVTGGTATATDNDYTATAPVTMQFTPGGSLTRTFSILIHGDEKVELDETIEVSLSNLNKGALDVVLGQTVGIATVANDDVAVLSLNSVGALEGDAGDQQYVFTLSVDREVDVPFTIDFATSNQTATSLGAAADYAAASGTLSFTGQAGQAQQVLVTVHGDETVELDETFALSLLNLQAGSRNIQPAAAATGTIRNDDQSSLTIMDAALVEGDSGAQPLTFTIALSKPLDTPLVFRAATADSTATVAGGDYTAFSSPLVLQPGQTSETVSVNVLGDTLVELNEVFFVDISNVQGSGRNLVIADARAEGQITNNDTAELSINDVTVTERDSGQTNATFTITMSRAVDAAVEFSVASADQTATAASGDYAALAAQRIAFIPGQSLTRTVTVQVNGDELVELDETFLVELTALDNAGRSVSISDGQGAGTIVNDDAGEFVVEDLSRLEGDSGTRLFEFFVVLSNAVDTTVTVDVETAPGTATPDDQDYVPPEKRTLTFHPGEALMQSVVVEVTRDLKVEANETFFVRLSNAVGNGRNVFIRDGEAIGTILNDDSATLSIDDVALEEGNSGITPFTFTVRLSHAVDVPVLLDVESVNGSATVADNDYTFLPRRTLTFDPGSPLTQQVTVDVIGDLREEPDEDFTLRVSNHRTPAGERSVSISKSDGRGTILNDDGTTAPLPSPASSIVSGSVFIDHNRDGQRGSSEVGVPSVNVFLTGTSTAGASVEAENTTDSGGRFEFNVPAGNYTLRRQGLDAMFSQQDADSLPALQVEQDQTSGNHHFAVGHLQPSLVTAWLFLGSTPNVTTALYVLMNCGRMEGVIEREVTPSLSVVMPPSGEAEAADIARSSDSDPTRPDGQPPGEPDELRGEGESFVFTSLSASETGEAYLSHAVAASAGDPTRARATNEVFAAFSTDEPSLAAPVSSRPASAAQTHSLPDVVSTGTAARASALSSGSVPTRELSATPLTFMPDLPVFSTSAGKTSPKSEARDSNEVLVGQPPQVLPGLVSGAKSSVTADSSADVQDASDGLPGPLETAELGELLPTTEFGDDDALSPMPASAALLWLLSEGKRSQAVGRYQRETGCDRRRARRAIDALARRHGLARSTTVIDGTLLVMAAASGLALLSWLL